MFRMEGGERECEQGERWISSGLVLTRCTQRSGAVFRGVSSGGGARECERECERVGFDAVYAAFRRSVLRCFERGGERECERFGFDAVYAAFRRSVSRCFEVIFMLRYTFV